VSPKDWELNGHEGAVKNKGVEPPTSPGANPGLLTSTRVVSMRKVRVFEMLFWFSSIRDMLIEYVIC